MLIPILKASDATDLNNFTGDKQLLVVYIIIVHIRSTMRNIPMMHV